jgi:SagB-type dehydrogenase family enzyme
MYWPLDKIQGFYKIHGYFDAHIEESGNLVIYYGNLVFEYNKKYAKYIDIIKILSKKSVSTSKFIKQINDTYDDKKCASDFIKSLISNGIICWYQKGGNSLQFHKESSYGHFEESNPKEMEILIRKAKTKNENYKGIAKDHRDFSKFFVKNKSAKYLFSLLNERVSRRIFNKEFIDREVFNFILWASCGENSFNEKNNYRSRTIPSAGAIYPVKLYVLCLKIKGVEKGFYKYDPEKNILERKDKINMECDLNELFITKHIDYDSAGAIFFMSFYPHHVLGKYGDRGYRYALLESGHIAQNICFACASCNIGSVVVGGFNDDIVNMNFNLPVEGESMIYSVVIGT